MTGRDVDRDDMFDHDPSLAALARDLQDAAAATPAPAIGASLAAVLEGRAPATVYPEVHAPRRERAARRPVRLRWAAGVAAFGVGVGSLGVAGALPGPVQRQVARMAEVVGVHLPDGVDRPGPTTTTTTPPTTSTSTPATTTASTPATAPVVERPGEDRRPVTPPGRPDETGKPDEIGKPATPTPSTGTLAGDRGRGGTDGVDDDGVDDEDDLQDERDQGVDRQNEDDDEDDGKSSEPA